MSKLMAAIQALRYGASLADPAIHKQRQNLINTLIGLMGALTIFFPMEVSSENIADLAGGIAALVGLYNVYTTTATTDKIGLQPKGDDTGNTPGAVMRDTANKQDNPYTGFTGGN